MGCGRQVSWKSEGGLSQPGRMGKLLWAPPRAGALLSSSQGDSSVLKLKAKLNQERKPTQGTEAIFSSRWRWWRSSDKVHRACGPPVLLPRGSLGAWPIPRVPSPGAGSDLLSVRHFFLYRLCPSELNGPYFQGRLSQAESGRAPGTPCVPDPHPLTQDFF